MPEDYDKLTGLPSRANLESAILEQIPMLVMEVSISPPDGVPYSVVLFDVDYFKAINDLYSHPQGDVALRSIAEVLLGIQKQKAELGLLGRWGGEEFLIALPRVLGKTAVGLAESIRQLISEKHIPSAQESHKFDQKITVSMGVHSVDLVDLLDDCARKSVGKPLVIDEQVDKKVLEQIPKNDLYNYFKKLVGPADVALNYAKFLGRNRVAKFDHFIKREMRNIDDTRKLYFQYSRIPTGSNPIFNDSYLQKAKPLLNKLRRHFAIICSEVHERDTRSQAMFADNLYRLVLTLNSEQKKQYLTFVHHYVR
ncbi:MAG: GGDEF domain-containing protein [Candidatus Woesearchaeota archaeon]|nr:GGDEF domain-containing protein [Candidatus Woesearchaeota archaeon]